ncbi:MAG: bifunctional phosphopantothenoylcysteine decarboxylase/phosphopantothenate--cysteine ligase CoaBC [Acidobacteriota bacterium]|nr:bifunctional phosphopantothenoylcysteine decarboxylase/phosphopantothenate--cysteine ligase CoaBC [Acidobacteriota bacterium]
MADDLLSTIHLAFRGPVVLAPAMNPGMWEHEQTRENVARLEARGVVVVPPEEGFVACGDDGAGRLADLQRITAEALIAARRSRSMEGRRIVVSAGPTREPVDPVRYLGNRSSGKMGYAIAAAVRARGAEVVLISGPVCLPPPWGVDRVSVETASEMHQAVFEAAAGAAAVVMAAAVADHRPADPPREKISLPKGTGYTLELEANPDILADLARARAGGRLPAELLLVGFAAEIGDAVAKGVAKRERKGCDLLLANDVSRPGSGFEVETNEVALIGPQGGVERWPKMSKRQVAEHLADAMEKWWRR